MFENISIGKYIPGDSFIHRLDPRIKFLVSLLFLAALILCKSFAGLALMTGLTLGHILISKLTWHDVTSSLKPVIPLLVLAFALNVFLPEAGDPYIFSFYFLRVSQKSLLGGFKVLLRIANLIVISNIYLSLTTSSLALSDAAAALLEPFSRWGLPAQDVGMMMSIALRFIPTLLEETDNLMKAQSSRGANYDTGSFVQRIKGFIAVLVPLFVSSFHRAEALAEAMEARAYRSDIKRGKLHPLVMEKKDMCYFIFMLVMVLAIVIMDRLNILGNV